MAFDPSLPADSTKLRLAPGVIQDNWAAIQDGETTFKPKAINLNNRTVSGPTDDPTAIADAFLLYCKDDAAGNAEFYGINESSDIIQLTKGAPTVATTGITFLAGGLLLGWGQSATGAGLITVTGMTTIYQVVATVSDSSGTPTDRNIAINSSSGAANQFTVYSSSAGQVKWLAIGV